MLALWQGGEKGLAFQYLLQGLASNGLTSSHQAPPPKGLLCYVMVGKPSTPQPLGTFQIRAVAIHVGKNWERNLFPVLGKHLEPRGAALRLALFLL